MVDPEFLIHTALFGAMTPAEREQLARRMFERCYRKGAVIFAEGQPGEAFYLVREGRVKVYRLSSEGQEQIMAVFGPGHPFGLVPAMDGSPFLATAEAVEDSRVWVLRREDLQRMMEEHPSLSGGVLREIRERLRLFQGRVHALATHSVRQRLAGYLLEQVRMQGRPDLSGPLRIRLTMTHQELGSYLGASRETVTRALADLRREGVINIDSDVILTLDPEQLRALLEA